MMIVMLATIGEAVTHHTHSHRFYQSDLAQGPCHGGIETGSKELVNEHSLSEYSLTNWLTCNSAN